MILTVDIEGDGLLDELTKIWCICAEDYQTGEMYSWTWETEGEIEEGIRFLEKADVLAFHNGIGYDEPAIKMLYPWVKFNRVVDTLVLSRLIWTDIHDRGINPISIPSDLTTAHSLKSWGYRLGELKGDFGEINDFKEWLPEMLTYCQQDVRITTKLLKKIAMEKYSPEAMQLEHDFARVIFKQERSGFTFDMDKAQILKEELIQKREQLKVLTVDAIPPTVTYGKKPSEYKYSIGEGFLIATTKGEVRRLAKEVHPKVTLKVIDSLIIAGEPRKIVTPFNPNSRQQVVQLFIDKYGWTPTEFTDKGNPKCNADILEKLTYPEAKPIADFLKVTKIYGMLAGSGGTGVPWMELVKEDGRIHGRVITNGAATGRCTHSTPNLGQVSSVQKDKEGNVLWGFEGGYGSDCRSLFTTDEGFLLVGADLSGIEARCLAHFMAPYDNGEYIDLILNGDVHTHNQQVGNLPTRSIAKKLLYMVMYGAGDKKIAQDIDVPLAEASKMKKDLLDGIPAIKKVIAKLKAELKRNKGWITGLDGRRLWIRGEHAILNMLLQNAGAVIMKKATILAALYLEQNNFVYNEDVYYCAHAHDEVQWAITTERADEAGKLIVKAMEDAGEYYKIKCPITGEYAIGTNWQETH